MPLGAASWGEMSVVATIGSQNPLVTAWPRACPCPEPGGDLR